jgi:hypothetical protein
MPAALGHNIFDVNTVLSCDRLYAGYPEPLLMIRLALHPDLSRGKFCEICPLKLTHLGYLAIGSLPKFQTSHGLLALFEKIYYREPIFTDFSNIGEDIQYRCFN